MFVLAQGTNSQKGDQRFKGQPSNPRANQYRICSVSAENVHVCRKC